MVGVCHTNLEQPIGSPGLTLGEHHTETVLIWNYKIETLGVEYRIMKYLGES